MELSYIIFSVFLVVGKYDSAPVYSNINTISPSLSAINFMKEYGYLESGTADSDALYEKNAITNAVKALQEFGNIPVTGQLDNTTLKLMASPRCGVPDILRKRKNLQRNKRFVIGSKGWKTRNITYFITNWTPKVGEEMITSEIGRTLNTWSGYSRLNFKPIHSPYPEIITAFNRKSHNEELVLQNKKK
ncbi:matrix metalloproteinase-24-like isoform X1 [Bombus huntii]|uniref:matrix metalloproteinase-24-like isoform X1 n=1 Tax=Bombus huntii TaxID=85661 RepID=UPI0021AA9367|nr:matrix metalloproteinase-24-like isoform X1 [Bombus huntii]